MVLSYFAAGVFASLLFMTAFVVFRVYLFEKISKYIVKTKLKISFKRKMKDFNRKKANGYLPTWKKLPISLDGTESFVDIGTGYVPEHNKFLNVEMAILLNDYFNKTKQIQEQSQKDIENFVENNFNINKQVFSIILNEVSATLDERDRQFKLLMEELLDKLKHPKKQEKTYDN